MTVLPGRKSSRRVFPGSARFSSLFLPGSLVFDFLVVGIEQPFLRFRGRIVSQKFEGRCWLCPDSVWSLILSRRVLRVVLKSFLLVLIPPALGFSYFLTSLRQVHVEGWFLNQNRGGCSYLKEKKTCRAWEMLSHVTLHICCRHFYFQFLF